MAGFLNLLSRKRIRDYRVCSFALTFKTSEQST